MNILDASIINILKNYAVSNKTICERLDIELIETKEIVNYADAKKNLLMLKNLGYKIFIDDFGSCKKNH